MIKTLELTLNDGNQAAHYILAEPEYFKGIVYVRLSALPIEQKTEICAGNYSHGIIKILKEHSLINDCMIYADYVEWHKNTIRSI